MKLDELKIHACVGEAPTLRFNGKRAYFPHIHIGEGDTCSHPKFYRSADRRDGLTPARGDYLTINQVGPHNHDGQVPFDAVAQLFAAAPALLRLLRRLTDEDRQNGNQAHVLARALVDRLLALDIPEDTWDGWGPYFNADGTPWEEGQ